MNNNDSNNNKQNVKLDEISISSKSSHSSYFEEIESPKNAIEIKPSKLYVPPLASKKIVMTDAERAKKYRLKKWEKDHPNELRPSENNKNKVPLTNAEKMRRYRERKNSNKNT